MVDPAAHARWVRQFAIISAFVCVMLSPVTVLQLFVFVRTSVNFIGGLSVLYFTLTPVNPPNDLMWRAAADISMRVMTFLTFLKNVTGNSLFLLPVKT